MNKRSYKFIKTINLRNKARKSFHATAATRKTLHYHHLNFCLVKDIQKNHKEKGRIFGDSTLGSLAISSSSLSKQFFQCRFNRPICLKD